MQNLDRIQAVQKTPFVNKGREVGVGMDCWGVIMYLCEGYNIYLPDFNIDAFISPMIFNTYIDQMTKNFIPLKKEDLTPGDIVTLAIDPRTPDIIQHFGVYIGNGNFIHTLAKTGPIICKLTDPLWGRRIKGYGRWVGGSDEQD